VWVPRLAEHLFADLPEVSTSDAASGRSDGPRSWAEDDGVTVFETLLAALHGLDVSEPGVARPPRGRPRASVS
jgi:hypothetical protein